jgi:hypothetical protein
MSGNFPPKLYVETEAVQISGGIFPGKVIHAAATCLESQKAFE